MVFSTSHWTGVNYFSGKQKGWENSTQTKLAVPSKVYRVAMSACDILCLIFPTRQKKKKVPSKTPKNENFPQGTRGLKMETKRSSNILPTLVLKTDSLVYQNICPDMRWCQSKTNERTYKQRPSSTSAILFLSLQPCLFNTIKTQP